MTESVLTEAGAAPATPALPIDNSRVWLLVAAPLLIFAIDAMFLFSGHSDVSTVGFGVALAVTIGITAWDSRYLRSRGVNVSASLAWLVPLYLFRRARDLGQSQAPLAAWIAVFVVSVAAGLALDAHFVTLDMPKVQTDLQQWTDQQAQTTSTVSCPSRDTYAVGATFICTVSDSTGSGHLLVKVEDGAGAITWNLIG